MVSTLSLPIRLRPPDLLHTTDRYADDVLSGRYDGLLPAGGLPSNERRLTGLDGDEELVVRLISWSRIARPNCTTTVARSERSPWCPARLRKHAGTGGRSSAVASPRGTRPPFRSAGYTTSCGHPTGTR